MRYYLSRNTVLKRLEQPSLYHIKKDDLYELDSTSFRFLKTCMTDKGCTSKDQEFIDYCLKEGLITQKKTVRKRPVVKRSPRPSLRYLELQITERCNLRCKHCFIGDSMLSEKGHTRDLSLQKKDAGKFTRLSVKPQYHELAVSQIRAILREFEQMQGLRVLITGGEPLLHRNFMEMNDMLPDFSVRKVLFTNGIMLNKNTAKRLNVEEIQVSIDGHEASHDSLRGKGTFRAALKAVKTAIDAGLDVSVATMVHAKNLRDFGKLDRLFRKIGIKDWTVDIPCREGRLREHADFWVSPDRAGTFLRYGFGAGLHAGASGFGCGLHLMAVMANGTIAKCTFFSDKAAGTIQEGLRKGWKKIKPIRLEELECDCDYLEECRGGCRYRALLSGSIKGKDLYKCYYYDTMK